MLGIYSIGLGKIVACEQPIRPIPPTLKESNFVLAVVAEVVMTLCIEVNVSGGPIVLLPFRFSKSTLHQFYFD